MDDFDSYAFRQVINWLLVMRDECRDESGLAVSVWQSAIDRATFGLAVLEHMTGYEGVTASAALSFFDELDNEPDGLPAAFAAVAEFGEVVPCSFGDESDDEFGDESDEEGAAL